MRVVGDLRQGETLSPKLQIAPDASTRPASKLLEQIDILGFAHRSPGILTDGDEPALCNRAYSQVACRLEHKGISLVPKISHHL